MAKRGRSRTGTSPTGGSGRGEPESVWANGEYRALWFAQALSLVGDRLARVALVVLVYARTGSPLWTALTYAATFLPYLVGVALAGIADRAPRRTVMVVCDLARAALVAVMAVPGVPLVVLVGMMFVVGLFNSPFGAARRALFRSVFPDQVLYSRATAVANSTFQVAQLVGFAAGGAAVATLGTGGSLVADAVTFGVSAGFVVTGVQARPRPAAKSRHWWADLVAGSQLVFGDRDLRTLVTLAWLATLYIAPDGLATPYAASQGAGGRGVGMLLAAIPVGTIAGNMMITHRRVSERTRQKAMIPLAAATGLPLAACVVQPGLVVCWLLWAASGFLSAYQIPAAAAFGSAVPDERAGQAWGLLVAGQQIGQGLGLLAAGALAERVAPLSVVAGAGVAGVLVAGTLATRTRSATDRLREAS